MRGCVCGARTVWLPNKGGGGPPARLGVAVRARRVPEPEVVCRICAARVRGGGGCEALSGCAVGAKTRCSKPAARLRCFVCPPLACGVWATAGPASILTPRAATSTLSPLTCADHLRAIRPPFGSLRQDGGRDPRLGDLKRPRGFFTAHERSIFRGAMRRKARRCGGRQKPLRGADCGYT